MTSVVLAIYLLEYKSKNDRFKEGKRTLAPVFTAALYPTNVTVTEPFLTGVQSLSVQIRRIRTVSSVAARADMCMYNVSQVAQTDE